MSAKKTVVKANTKKEVAKSATKKTATKVPETDVVKKTTKKDTTKKVATAKPATKKTVANKAPDSKTVKKGAVKQSVTKKTTVKAPKASVIKKATDTKKTVKVEPKKVTTNETEINNEKRKNKELLKTIPEKKANTSIVNSFSKNISRYSDDDLNEFKELILNKLSVSRDEYNILQRQLQNPNENDTDETSSSYLTLDDGSLTFEKENTNQLAARLKKFISNLEMALIRIENKTYGICRMTGNLISKDRLKAVPHTTLSMEAKVNQYK